MTALVTKPPIDTRDLANVRDLDPNEINGIAAAERANWAANKVQFFKDYPGVGQMANQIDLAATWIKDGSSISTQHYLTLMETCKQQRLEGAVAQYKQSHALINGT